MDTNQLQRRYLQPDFSCRSVPGPGSVHEEVLQQSFLQVYLPDPSSLPRLGQGENAADNPWGLPPEWARYEAVLREGIKVRTSVNGAQTLQLICYYPTLRDIFLLYVDIILPYFVIILLYFVIILLYVVIILSYFVINLLNFVNILLYIDIILNFPFLHCS